MYMYVEVMSHGERVLEFVQLKEQLQLLNKSNSTLISEHTNN